MQEWKYDKLLSKSQVSLLKWNIILDTFVFILPTGSYSFGIRSSDNETEWDI